MNLLYSTSLKGLLGTGLLGTLMVSLPTWAKPPILQEHGNDGHGAVAGRRFRLAEKQTKPAAKPPGEPNCEPLLTLSHIASCTTLLEGELRYNYQIYASAQQISECSNQKLQSIVTLASHEEGEPLSPQTAMANVTVERKDSRLTLSGHLIVYGAAEIEFDLTKKTQKVALRYIEKITGIKKSRELDCTLKNSILQKLDK